MGVEKTKEEWARLHLAQMGNDDPSEQSIRYYVGFITIEEDQYDPFFKQQYERWLARDEDEARIEYDRKQEEQSKKTLNEQYMEDEDNAGPFFNTRGQR